MERIVIEVNDRLAKAWRNAPEEKKKAISNSVNISLAKAFQNSDNESYLHFLNELRQEMTAKGLTEEELNDILNEE